MIKKNAIKLTLLLSVMLPFTANAAEGMINYVRIDGGWSVVKLPQKPVNYSKQALQDEEGQPPITSVTENRYEGKTKGSFVGNLGFGLYLAPEVRLELAASHRPKYSYGRTAGNVTESQKISASTLMANLYYDIKVTDRITPFVMGGVGLGRVKPKSYVIKEMGISGESDERITGVKYEFPGKAANGLAWNIGGGIAFKVIDNIFVDLSYRYVSLGKIKTLAGAATTIVSAGDSVPYDQTPANARHSLSPVTTNFNVNEVLFGFRLLF
jgi:opacity protein-like surface antigen